MRIPEETIQEVRSRSDIVELINSYVPLKKTGNTWQACCPFHKEKTPSFKVNQDKQIYHCFGCGKGGNIFTFIMESEGVDFPEAVRILAGRYNIIIPEESSVNASGKGSGVSRERLYLLHEKASEWFREQLWNNTASDVHRYFLTRGIPREAALKFGIGAAPESWDAFMNYALDLGFSRQEILDGGLILESSKQPGRFYDRFRNRLIFPITNDQGRVVAFSARAVTEDVQGAKYVNSPETAIFRKSAVLYGFSLARKAAREAGAVILCEGQLDVIAMYRAGFKNSVAPQGTAFTDEQATKLKRFAGTLYLAFDSDTAGIKATVRAVELALDAGFDSLKIIEFPAGGDPDEILKKEGAAAIAKLVKKAPDFFSYLIKCFSGQYDVSTPAGKGRLVGELVNYIARVRNSVARASYASSAAAALGVPETAVFQELNRFKNKKRFYGNKTSYREPEATEISEVVSQPESIVDAEKELLRIVLAHGTSAEKLSSQLPHEMISKTPVGRALEKVIQLTMNGEWEFAEEALLKNGGGPDPLVTEILAENSEISKEYQQKALSDCVKTIKSYYVQTQIDEIKRQLPLTNAPETKKELLRKFTEHTRKLAEIRQNPV